MSSPTHSVSLVGRLKLATKKGQEDPGSEHLPSCPIQTWSLVLAAPISLTNKFVPTYTDTFCYSLIRRLKGTANLCSGPPPRVQKYPPCGTSTCGRDPVICWACKMGTAKGSVPPCASLPIPERGLRPVQFYEGSWATKNVRYHGRVTRRRNPLLVLLLLSRWSTRSHFLGSSFFQVSFPTYSRSTPTRYSSIPSILVLSLCCACLFSSAPPAKQRRHGSAHGRPTSHL